MLIRAMRALLWEEVWCLFSCFLSCFLFTGHCPEHFPPEELQMVHCCQQQWVTCDETSGLTHQQRTRFVFLDGPRWPDVIKLDDPSVAVDTAALCPFFEIICPPSLPQSDFNTDLEKPVLN